MVPRGARARRRPFDGGRYSAARRIARPRPVRGADAHGATDRLGDTGGAGGNYRRDAALIESDGVEAFLAAPRDGTPPPATAGAPETVPDVADALLPSLLRGAALSDLPTPGDIARIDVPTTILAWIDDPGHPLSTAQALVALLPQAALSVAHSPAELETWPQILAQDVARAASTLGAAAIRAGEDGRA